MSKWKCFVVNGCESKNLFYTATEFFVSFQDEKNVSMTSAIMLKKYCTSVECVDCL